MTSILRSYNNFVLRNPLIAMSLTTGILFIQSITMMMVCLNRNGYGIGKYYFTISDRKKIIKHS